MAFDSMKPIIEASQEASSWKKRVCCFVRSNLGFNKINKFEIATSRKMLLAMTFREFFSSLLKKHHLGKRGYAVLCAS